MLGPKIPGPVSPSKSSSRYTKEKIEFEEEGDSDFERVNEDEGHGRSVITQALGKLDISAIENPPEANLDMVNQSDKFTMLS